MALASRGRYLVSASQDGKTVVYDYGRMEVDREIELSQANIGAPIDLLIMEDEKTLIISDRSGLHPIDIETASKREACYPGKANQMAKLNAKTREGVAIFAGCFEDGSVRLFRD